MKPNRFVLIYRALTGQWWPLLIGAATKIGWEYLDIKKGKDDEVEAFTITDSKEYLDKISEID